mmetsp:Transcript_54079/g.116081  ORF Transcript_54079/g.116081 Transcript_54079/m.116081 type:complete len:671 (-) Transcript_54079:473-2485(-)|eukprot:CAMPEP_0204356756 /NCGR_PEP_ID=MMETSP0469-20131031/35182_1 /ASSEMBLY_ACC=CAM_ASM_000384 /TAXON_ID=2969 /ORGANISM="Oxyrrhis marina" /LENGTH=670 /DNA_ID=CAMNT_0051344271 /DNA_START=10 /DNA_END=2022 /DNA_ORIENTATION=-
MWRAVFLAAAAASNATSPCDLGDMSFPGVAARFARYHTNELNINAHLVTTPLGIMGVTALGIKVSGQRSAPALVLFLLYSASLLLHFPMTGPLGAEWEGAFSPRAMPPAVLCVLMGVLMAAANVAILHWAAGFACLVVGYFGQDVAHWYTGEQTYQSAYTDCSMDFAAWISLFYEHIYYLLPLCIEVAGPAARSALVLLPLWVVVHGNYALDSTGRTGPWSFVRSRIVFGKIGQNDPQGVADMSLIRKWVGDKNPPKDKTMHVWVKDLPDAEREAFGRLENSPVIAEAFAKKFDPARFKVDVIRGMNEVYVSGPNRAGNSDTVFFTKHVDGPWCWFPFCSVYRSILAIDANTEYSTHFNQDGPSFTLASGDFCSFDFHREPHFITEDGPKNPTHRVILKLHYVTYPVTLAFMGNLLHWMSVKYNEAFRALFLYTIVPQTPFQKAVARLGVIGGTELYHGLEVYCGYSNLLFYLTSAFTSWFLECPMFFLCVTSFVHYCRYINTYYIRQGANFNVFKRDVLLFKTVALIQMLYFYSRPYLAPYLSGVFPVVFGLVKGHEDPAVNWISLAMIVTGYTISLWATKALGVDGTYFGIELGHVKKQKHFVVSFPYSVLPHPMILSQVFALAGIFMVPHVHEQYPYLIPCHILMYFVHMTQEQFDVYADKGKTKAE